MAEAAAEGVEGDRGGGGDGGGGGWRRVAEGGGGWRTDPFFNVPRNSMKQMR